MLHFETIWNQAESVSKSFADLNRKQILGQIRTGMDNLADSDSLAEYNEALGDILFCLCMFCAHLEDKKGLTLNSAAALTQTIAKKRAELVEGKPNISDKLQTDDINYE
jgi:NTP pyrophosphatase (non-canonical NTP hydrolase)